MNLSQILDLLRKNFGSDPVNWLDASDMSLNGTELHIAFIHPYLTDWFTGHVENRLIDFFTKNLPQLVIIIHKNDKIANSGNTTQQLYFNTKFKEVKEEEKSQPGQEKSNYFADFIFNEKNALAVRAAHSLATLEIPRNLPGITVFYGPSSSGKTHLLKAIQQQRAFSGDKFCPLLSGSSLARDFENMGLTAANYPSRLPRLLLIDALQDMENSHSLISLICALCDEALNGNNKFLDKAGGRAFNMALAISADSLKMARLPEGIISRLEQGLCFGLKQADLDVRLRYGEKYNREQGLGINRSQLINIARHTLKITEIRGLLHKIEFFVTLQGKGSALKDIDTLLGQENLAKPTDWQRVIENVAKRFTLTSADILGNARKADYVLPRQIAMYLARSKLALSFQEIGKLFGGKDHSTVMHSVKKIQRLRQVDKDMHKLLTELENECG